MASAGASGASKVEGVVHPEARLEDDLRVEPGAVVGARAELGRGSVISSGAIVAEKAAIGRQCFVGRDASIRHALIGDRVAIHSGARIGEAGSAQSARPGRHVGMPLPVGRVIVQDGAEIGANSTVARGSGRDTVVGEGTRIDNHVQIAQNVEIGRHCTIGTEVDIADAARLGDFVVIGSRSKINSGVTIGEGAEVAPASAVEGDIPAHTRWAGAPARPVATPAPENGSGGGQRDPHD
jgi:UDP-3-O-[3-hydroxymyristoyl] glucosamine N-acyltransferase